MHRSTVSRYRHLASSGAGAGNRFRVGLADRRLRRPAQAALAVAGLHQADRHALVLDGDHPAGTRPGDGDCRRVGLCRHVTAAGHLRRRRHGTHLRSWRLSPQKPIREAYEQNSEAVARWLEVD
ncbi:winged helix-turn-helix domain-containing protein [Micromonospora sp. NBC_00858]|uniref:winged helix-turn-helix domain-containing protein n=1 Tax=Micromonospora sp. NBC_00858 TaxID=2975979 RepID=UPI00386409F0